jgi:hypothetical protein
VAEEIADGDDADAVSGRGGDEFFEIAPRVGAGAGDAGERWVINRVLKMQIQPLVAPLRVAGQEFEKVVETLDLAGEVPLKGAEHGRDAR